MDRRPRVVIVGAGFGGLWAAKGLAGADMDVTVIDRHNYHLFQPLLYQVASAGLAATDIAWPIRAVLGRQGNTTVVMDEVVGVDVTTQQVLCETHPPIPYDSLILATGARHAYFGNDQWEMCAPGLKDLDDAIGIRRSILCAFERAESTVCSDERRRLLTFVVVGAGPTGVEMAGALAELAHRTLARDFRHINPGCTRIVLVEASSRVLPTFPKSLSCYAYRALKKLDVEVRLGEAVTACNAGSVVVGGTQLPAGTVIWAAGVQASPIAAWLEADCDPSGRIVVDERLSIPSHSNVYVIGDAAAVKGHDGAPVSGIAPAARQQGRYIARKLMARWGQGKDPGSFHYRHRGNLATIGRYAAVIDLGRVRIKGRIAWWLWGGVHIHFLIGVRSPIVVALEWFWSYITSGKGARIILGARQRHSHRTLSMTHPYRANVIKLVRSKTYRVATVDKNNYSGNKNK